MPDKLSLVHSLGYCGQALQFCGGSSVLYGSGSVLKRLTSEGGEASSVHELGGLGVGQVAVSPQCSHAAVAERGCGSAPDGSVRAGLSLFALGENGAMELLGKFDDAGAVDIDCMSFSPDGELLVTVSSLPDFKINVWEWGHDMRTPRATGTAPGEVKQCAVNPENPFQLALVSGDALYICNLVTGSAGDPDQQLEMEFVAVPPVSKNATFVAMAWGADGRLFATTSDADDGANLWTVNPQNNAVEGDSVVVSQDPMDAFLLVTPRHLVCWCGDGSVTWVGLDTLAEGHRIKMPLPDGVSLVSACVGGGAFGDIFLGTSAGSVYFLEVKRQMPDGAFGDGEDEPSATTVKDPEALSGQVQFCSHHSLRRLTLAHGARISAVCAANGGDAVASASEDGSLMIWDVMSASPLAAHRLAHAATSLSPHPFEPLLALGDAAGFVYVIDAGLPARLKCKLSARLFRGGVAGLCFNDDGSLLAVTAKDAPQVYLVSFLDKSPQVMGFLEFPLVGGLVANSVRWAGSRHVVVADSKGFLLACTDIPGKDGDALQLKAGFTGLDTGAGGVTSLCCAGDQVLVSAPLDKTVRAYRATGWARVTNAEDLAALGATAAEAEWAGHGKQVQALAALPGSDLVASSSADGSVCLRGAAQAGQGVLPVRVNSLWRGGSSAVSVFKKDGKTIVVAVGACDGTVSILTPDPAALKGRGLGVASAASSVSARLVDALGEAVEASVDEATHAEKLRLADQEMEIALNAAKKNAFRDSIRQQKAALDDLLAANAAAPEMERLPREDIVVDRGMREQIIAAGDARVMETQDGIRRDNLVKQTTAQRIKTIAWDSMDVHGAELRGFCADVGVFNYPIQKVSDEEALQLQRVRAQRRIEIAALALERQHLAESSSLIGLDEAHAVGPESLAESVADKSAGEGVSGEGGAAEADAGKALMTPEEMEEAWRKRQFEPLMYHRLEATTRERKTAQLIMLEHVIRTIKASFNAKFAEFVKKKGQSLGRVDEKMARLLEIHKELKTSEVVDKVGMADSEQPEQVLVVDDSEIGVDKWVSPAELKAREEEEQRAREAAGSDDTAERALNQMMGGTLAGADAIGVLDKVMEKPAHLVPAEGETVDMFDDDRKKELKEWEAAFKRFEDDREAYRRTLEAEAKKLKAEMTDECNRFDESITDLASQRMRTDYKVYELELYRLKMRQGIAQEEDDVLVQRSLKEALLALEARQADAVSARDEFAEEVSQVDAGVRAEGDKAAALEKAMVKEVVNPISKNNEQLGEHVLRAYRKRHDMTSLREAGLADDELALAHQHLEAARQHDDRVHTMQAHLDEMRADHARLAGAADQVMQQRQAAEAELAALEERMAVATTDLDITLSVKQGQVEVEQAAVVTDMADALVVERGVIEACNGAITARGDDKIAVLHEIKDFRKGIHELQWNNQRLELEEEDLLQRTRDLQLLRVTKSLQSVIKGGGDVNDTQETAKLDKLYNYQVNAHKARVAEKLKTVQALQAQVRSCHKENVELDDDIFALESAVVERERLCKLQGVNLAQQPDAKKASGPPPRNAKEAAKMNMMVTHRKLLDLAKAQTREIELMREELVRLRARTFPSFAQLSA